MENLIRILEQNTKRTCSLDFSMFSSKPESWKTKGPVLLLKKNYFQTIAYRRGKIRSLPTRKFYQVNQNVQPIFQTTFPPRSAPFGLTVDLSHLNICEFLMLEKCYSEHKYLGPFLFCYIPYMPRVSHPLLAKELMTKGFIEHGSK